MPPAYAIPYLLPVLGVLVFLISVAAGLWRGFSWLKNQIVEVVQLEFTKAAVAERAWKDDLASWRRSVVRRQNLQARSILEAHRRVDKVGDAHQGLLMELVRQGLPLKPVKIPASATAGAVKEDADAHAEDEENSDE